MIFKGKKINFERRGEERIGEDERGGELNAREMMDSASPVNNQCKVRVVKLINDFIIKLIWF
jgi:hypothetical protein